MRIHSIRPTAQTTRAIRFRGNRIPRVQVKIGKMQHLDPLPARHGHLSITRLRLRKQARRVEHRICRRLRAKRAAPRITNVPSIETTDVGVRQDLCPYSAECGGVEIADAGCVIVELVLLT